MVHVKRLLTTLVNLAACQITHALLHSFQKYTRVANSTGQCDPDHASFGSNLSALGKFLLWSLLSDTRAVVCVYVCGKSLDG